MLGWKAGATLLSFFLVLLALGLGMEPMVRASLPSVGQEGQAEECLSRNVAPSVSATNGLH